MSNNLPADRPEIRCQECHESRCAECPRTDPRGRLAADDHRYPTCCCGRVFRTEVATVDRRQPRDLAQMSMSQAVAVVVIGLCDTESLDVDAVVEQTGIVLQRAGLDGLDLDAALLGVPFTLDEVATLAAVLGMPASSLLAQAEKIRAGGAR